MSFLEDRFRAIWCDRYPDIVFAEEVRGIAGRQFRYDFAHHGTGVALEIQGGVWRASGKGAHTGGSAVERDSQKACLSHLNGWTVFPLTEKLMANTELLDAIAVFIRARRDNTPFECPAITFASAPKKARKTAVARKPRGKASTR